MAIVRITTVVSAYIHWRAYVNGRAERYTMAVVTPTPKFLFRLPTDLRAELDSIAIQEQRTLSNLIVYALREWLAGRGRAQGARD